MASRKEQKEALRQERLEREQKQAQANARKRLIGIVVAAILVLGIAGAIAAVVLSGGDDDGGGGGDTPSDTASVDFPEGGELPEQKEADFDAALEGSGCVHEQVKNEGAGQHTTDPVAYKTEPPSVGPHYPEWPEDDLYEEAPPTERVVHTLEHGRVLVWVRPDASEELLGQLKALYDEDPYHVIMLPRKELQEPVAVSTWQKPDTGHILRCKKPGDGMWDAIRTFKEKYRDQGPEFVP
jgi:hypothetical protein